MINKLKKIWIKNHPKFILFSAIILFVLGIANFFFVFDITAQSNDECLWLDHKTTPDSLSIIFSSVKVGGVSWEAGIRDGDELISIDGIRTRNTTIATQILDKVQAGDYASYKYRHDGVVKETKVLIKKLINFTGLAVTLLSFFWLLVGFVVVMAKPEGKTQLLFYRIGATTILYSMSSMLYRGVMGINPIFSNRILLLSVDTLWTFGGIFFPFLIVKFFSSFPKELPFCKKKWVNRAFVFVPLALFIIVTALKFFWIYTYKGGMYYQIIANSILLMMLFGFILGLILLFRSYVKLSDPRERTSIFVILVSYMIGVLALLYTTTLATSIAGVIFNNPAYFTPIFLIALLPVAFGYSIFKYSLMDVSGVVKNTIVYGTATVSLAAIYFLLIYVIGTGISAAIGTEYKGWIAGFVFVVFAIAFQSSKDRFQDFLTAKFYPEQFMFQKQLLKFSSDITSIVGRENILDAIQELFVKSLHIENFGLLLKDENYSFNLVRSEGIENKNLQLVDSDFKIEGFCIECNSFGKKQVLERQDFNSVMGSSSQKFIDTDIYTIIPLFMKSKLIGLLAFGLKQTGSQFSGKDLDHLLAAANQTAISIENARLYESETEKQKLERDLENARRIQETLLPKTLPSLKNLDIAGRMIPAMHVGGDYFDVIEVSDKKLFAVVGDVSGKGLSASFYMSKLQTMIRLYCTEDKSPKEVLVEVNKRIFESIEKNWFITVSLALLDFETGTMKYCRAGHTPLIRIHDNHYLTYQPAGMGVGLEKGELFTSSLEELVVPISKGDFFFFYSDGVTELMNPAGELYGDNRLRELLLKNVSEDCARLEISLLDDLNKFKETAAQYDDITLLMLKYS